MYTKRRHKIKKIVKLLKEGELVNTAVKAAGISRATLYRWRKEHPRLDKLVEEAINLCDNTRTSVVEDSLFAKAQAGNIIAMIFYLTNRAPNRWKNNRDRYMPESPHERQLRESEVEILTPAQDREAAEMLKEFQE